MVCLAMAPTTPALERVAAAVDAALTPLVRDSGPPGLTWGVDLGGERMIRALGHRDLDANVPAADDTIYRISSLTKPVTAVAALTLIEDGQLALDQPVGELLPELADPRVLVRPDSPLTETVPARRAITVEDLLTFRLGHGMDFATMGAPNPLDDQLATLGLGMGPPAPEQHLPADEWLAALGSVPLRCQPGERWLYNTGAELLGVLLSRVTGLSLGEVLHQQVLDPLGMPDTRFSVPAQSLGRWGPCFNAADPDGTPASRLDMFDPADGQWSSPPPFEGGDAGLVSTAKDYLTFAAMLRDGGSVGSTHVLSRERVEAMTTNQLSTDQLRAGGPSPDGGAGWGFGVGVALGGPTSSVVGSYGWDGGLGSAWRNDTARGLSAVLLTNQSWMSPTPPAVTEAFWSALAELLPLDD